MDLPDNDIDTISGDVLKRAGCLSLSSTSHANIPEKETSGPSTHPKYKMHNYADLTVLKQ